MSQGAAAARPDEAAPALPALPAEDEYALLSAQAEARNVNPVTLLATDYLNHFNEVVMLLEMLPLAPDCAADAAGWQPKSYEQHFRESGFRDRDFAIRAYAASPPRFRQPFDLTVAALDARIAEAVAECCDLARDPDPEALQRAVERHLPELRHLLERASALIHGYIEPEAAAADAQAAVDALFDD